MTSKKELAIQFINAEFEKMSNLVLSQLDLLEKVIADENEENIKDLAEILKKNEAELDNFEIILDNKIVQAIVLYKPVASDLRHIFALYRMMINLERIGDLIVKVYYFSQELKDKYFDESSTEYFLGMLRSATKMVRNSILSFMNTNVDEAIATIIKDDDIDKLNDKMLKKNLSKMKVSKESKELILNFVDMRSMISSVERIGDHATNIAEASIYAITGTNIAHQDIHELKQ